MRQKLVSLLVSVMLAFGLCPGLAHGDLTSGRTGTQAQSATLTAQQTALGLFTHIRDNSPTGSPAYVDAQCAIDILTGTVSDSVTYPAYQGSGQSETNTATNGASNREAYKAVNLESPGDAASLDNFKASLDWIDRYNGYRANENVTEGTSLATDVGMNCRMMALSIVMCDWSKATTAHSRAFDVGENLSWGYDNPFDGWYDEEKVEYEKLIANGKAYNDLSASEQGQVGHYLNIVDYVGTGVDTEHPTSVTGFATCQDGALYGMAHEQSFYTFGNWHPANVVYTTDEFRTQWFDAYYAENANGTSQDDPEPTPISINGASIAISGTGFTYTGNAITPRVTSVKASGAVIPASGYKVSYANNVKAGTATVSVTGHGDYKGTARKTFTIEKAQAKNFTVAKIPEKMYDGTAKKPTPTVRFAGKKLKKGTDYTLKYYANKAAGKATVTITGKGNFTGTKTTHFKITRAEMSKAKIDKIAAKTYNGRYQTPKPTVRVGDKILKKGRDYEVAYSSNLDAGTATVKITGLGNFRGSKLASFTIAKASISGASVSSIGDQRFTGAALQPQPRVTWKGETLALNRDFTLSYSSNVNAGTAYVHVNGMGNFSGTKTTSFRITAPPPPAGSETVYITNTGSKYHRSTCSSLRSSRIPIPKGDAIARGFEACKICRP